MKRALAISGFDPTGGAGILMDIKVFTRLEVYGYGVITAYTVQTPKDVIEIKPQEAKIFERSLTTVLYHMMPSAVKIGMLASSEIVNETAQIIKRFSLKRIVLDPVLRAKNGVPLITDDGFNGMIYKLFPLVDLVTPNTNEMSKFVGGEIKTIDDAKQAVIQFYNKFRVPVLLKGGHLKNDPVDIFYDGKNIVEFAGKREACSPHGTGCFFSSAIVAIFAKGVELKEAIAGAKKFTESIIRKVGDELLLPI